VPVGGEFRVNTYTTSSQTESSVAIDQAGDFVVAWTGTSLGFAAEQVYAQRYNAAGATQGGEFSVNVYVPNDRASQPSVAMDQSGNFVAAWVKNALGAGIDIAVQRFNSAGQPIGGEIPVNTFTTGVQIGPSVAMDQDGDFVVVWTDAEQDGSESGVFARRFNSAGLPQGGEFRVNSFTTGQQRECSVAMDQDGNFVVTWHSHQQDGSSFGIYAQRYNTAGAPLGSEFRVNSFTTGSQDSPSVAMDQDGDFVVAWTSYLQDGSATGAYAQRYNSAGVPQGAEFRASTYTTWIQGEPSTAMDQDGDFVIAWSSGGQDGSDSGVYAQAYRANGTLNGAEFRVNTYTTGYQSAPAVAMNHAGDFVVAWESQGQDGDGRGVYAQRFHLAVPTRVYAVRVNDNSVQRSRVSKLTVTFDSVVSFTGPVANAFTLTRTGGGPVAFSATAAVVNNATVVTLNAFTGPETQAGSLADGRFTLTALAGQITNANGQLDGNGDGIPGDNYTFSFHRLFGDNDGDGDADAADFAAFRGAFGNALNLAFDADGDGDVDAQDFVAFRGRFGSSIP